jgi:hypothetical protein
VILVGVNFQNVPLPEVACVLERLSDAGHKNFGDTKGAARATDEIRGIMGDYFMDDRGAG